MPEGQLAHKLVETLQATGNANQIAKLYQEGHLAVNM
jgi:hypothetical protein